MTRQKISWVLLAMLPLVMRCVDDDKGVEPLDERTYSFEVLRESAGGQPSAACSGALVAIQTRDGRYANTTDPRGKTTISIPNSVTLPEFTVFWVDHSAIMPESGTIPGDRNSSVVRTVRAPAVPEHRVVRSCTLHHTGDDIYEGLENSQLQIPTEGPEVSYSFLLYGVPPYGMPYIRFYARGVQERADIKLNGIIVGHFGDSAANGDLTLYAGRLVGDPSSIFHAGTNYLTVRSGPSSASDMWDDIEFCAMLLYFQ